jgi:tetratricopeptide (TPR) repeat protein
MQGPAPNVKEENPFELPDINSVDLGGYVRNHVTNVNEERGRAFFDMGLRLMLSYQHEMAARCFLACLQISKHCALAHGFVALCHSPNYNFKGEAYYESAHHPDEAHAHDLMCIFPSQQVADRHSKMAVDKIDEIRKLRRKTGKKGKGGRSKGKGKNNQSNSNGTEDEKLPDIISDVESRLLFAIRKLTCHPGLEHSLSDDIVGRPYADAMRSVYEKYPEDPEVAYCFAEALMVLNAWQLYEFPTGKAVSPDVDETRDVLEKALLVHKAHAGLCHMYVHLSEMSASPAKALIACKPLRDNFPHAGHLIHMPTHIDVLVGDYENCVRYNCKAIRADEKMMQISPGTAGRESFYFGYIVHNYHMAVYGALLGGFEGRAMVLARQLNGIISEDMFEEYPDLTAYLESYSALDIHVMVRFGRWRELLELEAPKNSRLMLFRAASIKFAKALAHASLGDVEEAKREANNFDSLRGDPDAQHRILHNNSVENLLGVDGVMARGEIAYREGNFDEAFKLLRKAVDMQDNLNYDEPWGKMQPIRHALGGLLLEQGRIDEAEGVFRKDLVSHPNNPWTLVGLIDILKKKQGHCCGGSEELNELQNQLQKQRDTELADFNIQAACACCMSGED